MTTCRFRAFASAFLLPLTLSVANADVTLRYKMEIKANPTLAAQKAAGAMSLESVDRYKGGKGFSAVLGFNSIVDFTTKEVTVLDTAGKRYAKVTARQLGEEMGRAMLAMPAQARASTAPVKADVAHGQDGRALVDRQAWRSHTRARHSRVDRVHPLVLRDHKSDCRRGQDDETVARLLGRFRSSHGGNTERDDGTADAGRRIRAGHSCEAPAGARRRRPFRREFLPR
jgi:hypothetical protein